jgi:phage major head subunit gpT-like protein
MAAVIKDLRTFSVAVNAAFKTALQGNSGDVSAQFTTEINMTTKRVEFPIAGNVGPMREWKGSRIIKSVSRSSYEMVAKKFEKTISISMEDVEDDNLDIYMPSINQLAFQVAQWKTQNVHKAIEANGLAFDSGGADVAFFATTHKELGANVSNYAAGANPAWYVFDTSKPVKPFIWGTLRAPKITPRTQPDDPHVFDRDELLWGARARGGPGYGLWQSAYKSKTALDATNFESVVTAMRSRVDDEGESLDIQPMLLVIPPALEWDAKRLFGRSTTTDGSENIHEGGIKVLVSNRLTGA